MKKLLMYLILLLPLALLSCGSDSKDEPTPTPRKGDYQVFQLNNNYDTFTLDGIQYNWSRYESAIESPSVKLKFYSTGKNNINDIKIPDIDINLWRDKVSVSDLIYRGGAIMAVEKSSGTYTYYCIFTEFIDEEGTGSSGSRYQLGYKLTIYRMK